MKKCIKRRCPHGTARIAESGVDYVHEFHAALCLHRADVADTQTPGDTKCQRLVFVLLFLCFRPAYAGRNGTIHDGGAQFPKAEPCERSHPSEEHDPERSR